MLSLRTAPLLSLRTVPLLSLQTTPPMFLSLRTSDRCHWRGNPRPRALYTPRKKRGCCPQTVNNLKIFYLFFPAPRFTLPRCRHSVPAPSLLSFRTSPRCHCRGNPSLSSLRTAIVLSLRTSDRCHWRGNPRPRAAGVSPFFTCCLRRGTFVSSDKSTQNAA